MIRSAIVSEGFKPVLTNNKSFTLEGIREIKTSYCAKNDFSYSQVLLLSDLPFVLSVDSKPCFYEKGITDVIRVEAYCKELPTLNIETYIVGLMEDDDGTFRADPLLNCNEKFVDKNELASVFLKIEIPNNIDANTYKIEIDLFHVFGFGDEKLVNSKIFNIRVFDFSFPDPKDFYIHLDLWQHNSNLARKYDVKLWSDKHFQIIDNYSKSMAQLGQKAITVIASEIPWCGQQSFKLNKDSANLYEYSCIKVLLNNDNKWEYNFEFLDKLIEINFKNHIDKEIEIFGLVGVWEFSEFGYGKVIENYSDAVRIRYFDQKTNTFKYINKIEHFQNYLEALERHFINNKLINKVRIVADEPSNMSSFTESINFITSVTPNFKFKAAINHKEFLEKEFDNLIDYVPILPFVCENKEILENIKKIKKDSKISTYVCCWPLYPNTFLNSPLYESRVIMWLVDYFNLDGFLRWNYTAWNSNPLDKIIYPAWPAGDTNFVYPGKDMNPIYSLRYYALKKGIRDFELLNICKKYPDGKKLVSKLQMEIFGKYKPEKLYDDNVNQNEIYLGDYDEYDEIVRRMLEFLTK